MSAKNSTELKVDFPIFGIKFIDNKTVLAVGGGGEGNNGIPNKITAVKCSLKVKDKTRRLQKYREITLPSNEDSPMCVETASVISDDDTNHYIFVGCNQSSALIKNMNVNNNLRKYGFTDDEHLKFLDAVQFDHAVLADSLGSYPKVIRLSPNSEVGAFMTSQEPSEVYIFRPDHLELVAKIRSSNGGTVNDFHVSQNDGRTLCLVTSSTVEIVGTFNGHTESVSSVKADKKTAKALAKYNLSKVRFISDSVVVITGSLKSGKGAYILRYDITKHKLLNETQVHKKGVVVVDIDVSTAQNLIALANNNQSVSLLRLSDFKVLSNIKNLHEFALTSVSFSPSGTKLASGSASHSLNVMPIPKDYAKGTSFIWSLFKFLMFVFVIFAGILLQQAAQAGQLDHYRDLLEQQIGPIDQYVELSKKYGEVASEKAQVYGKIALDLSQKYGSEYYDKAQVYGKIGYEMLKEKSAYGIDLIKEKMNQDKLDSDEDTKPFFTMTEWDDKAQTETATTSNQANDTLNDIVSQVTKDLGDITNVDVDIDTDSIIREAVTLDTQHTSVSTESTFSTDPASESDVEVENVETASSVLESSTNLDDQIAHETASVEQASEEAVFSEDEPESFAGTVLEDVRQVEEPTASVEETEETEVAHSFQNVEPEVVVEDEVTTEISVPSTESVETAAESPDAVEQAAIEETVESATDSATTETNSTTESTETSVTESSKNEDVVEETAVAASTEEPITSVAEEVPVESTTTSSTTVPTSAAETVEEIVSEILTETEEATQQSSSAEQTVAEEIPESVVSEVTQSLSKDKESLASSEPPLDSTGAASETLLESTRAASETPLESSFETIASTSSPQTPSSLPSSSAEESSDVAEEPEEQATSMTSAEPASSSAESEAKSEPTEEVSSVIVSSAPSESVEPSPAELLSEATSKLSSELSSLKASAASEDPHDEL